MENTENRGVTYSDMGSCHLPKGIQTITHPSKEPKRAAGYAIELQAGMHEYVEVEGVGECRANFFQLLQGMEDGAFDVALVYKASYLFVDTSPMWMEKFIATTVGRLSRRVLV
jgi:hypothetical protein